MRTPKVTIAGQRGRNAYVLSSSDFQVAMMGTDEAERPATEEPEAMDESEPTMTEGEIEAFMASLAF